MKICFLVSSLGAGGAERVAATLCNAWAERSDQVTLVSTFSGGGGSFYQIAEAVELVYLADVVGVRDKNVRNYARRIHALRKLVAARAPDVLVSFLPNVNVAAVLSSVLTGIPLIICERRNPASQPCGRFWEFGCRLTYRFADMLTVQTDSAAATVRSIYPGLRRVRFIPNPLPADVAAYRRQPSGLRKTLLSVGRLAPEKQINRLIGGFRDVASSYGDWDLHIYGDGPLRASLEALAIELGLQERIFFMGRTDHPWQVMASADAFAMTSKHEGFPNALLEAAAIGLPCITTDCPSGPREISRDGSDALLVPVADHAALVAALARIMGDPGLRDALGDRARHSMMSRFGLGAVLDEWDRLFSEVGTASARRNSAGIVPG